MKTTSGLNLNYLILAITITMVFTTCKSQKKSSKEGVLSGKIGIYVGDCMPSPSKPPCVAEGISSKVLITTPSLSFDGAIVVDSVTSDPSGLFSISLTEGAYSLFISHADSVICPVVNCPDECYCSLVEIKNGTETTTEININNATW